MVYSKSRKPRKPAGFPGHGDHNSTTVAPQWHQVGSFLSNLIHSVRNFQFDFFFFLVQENPGFSGFSGFRVDHRLRLFAFSIEIFIGGFNATSRDEGPQNEKSAIRFSNRNLLRDEERGVLENPEKPCGFPGHHSGSVATVLTLSPAVVVTGIVAVLLWPLRCALSLRPPWSLEVTVVVLWSLWCHCGHSGAASDGSVVTVMSLWAF